MCELINQRLGLLHCATLKKLQQLEERKVARVSREPCASVCGTLEEPTVRLQLNFNHLQDIHRSIIDAYVGTKHLYTEFVNLSFVIIVILTALYMLYSVMSQSSLFLNCYFVFVLLLDYLRFCSVCA